jgi:hypothetical protein
MRNMCSSAYVSFFAAVFMKPDDRDENIWTLSLSISEDMKTRVRVSKYCLVVQLAIFVNIKAWPGRLFLYL